MQNEAPTPPPSSPLTTTQEPVATADETTAKGYIQNDVASTATQVVVRVFAAMSSLL